ncbi:hypothetical protein IWZ01DRAFT_483621 [Phyllosticta capitalensis]
MSRKTFAILAAGAASVSAHGIILDISTGGKSYEGWSPNDVYVTPTPNVAAWHAGGYAMGPITDYSSSSMNCHDNATAARPHSGRPEVDQGLPERKWSGKPTLPLFLLTNVPRALITGGSVDEQVWATDKLRSDNKTVATIPSALKAGNYVFRNEIIALAQRRHRQRRPKLPPVLQCQGDGLGLVVAPRRHCWKPPLYKAKDLIFNIYDTVSSYTVPGPALWSAAGGSSGSSSSGAFDSCC